MVYFYSCTDELNDHNRLFLSFIISLFLSLNRIWKHHLFTPWFQSIYWWFFNHCIPWTVSTNTVHTVSRHTVTVVTWYKNQPCNNDKIAKLKSATDFISFNAANEHFSARCNTLAYFLDDVSCGRNNLFMLKIKVKGHFSSLLGIFHGHRLTHTPNLGVPDMRGCQNRSK